MTDTPATCPPLESDARRIVIVGGGYAGTTCAVELGRRLPKFGDAEILMVEPNPCQQALSELDLVAVGPPKAEFCELRHPIVFRNLPVHVCYTTVESIDPAAREVTIAEGQRVSYWRLVIATGAVPYVPSVPGLAEHALTMWSVLDARKLQRRVERQFRAAAKLVHREDRRRALSFAVVGGGATGVEIVGTMAQLLPKRMRERGLDPEELTVRLIEGRPQILYDLREKQRDRAAAHLRKMGVEVLTDAKVAEVHSDAVVLEDGARLDASVLVFAGGAQADPHAAQWGGFEADNSGRLVAAPDLKAVGHEDVYAIGDVASVRDPVSKRVLPMLAQMAIQEGPHVAKNLLRELAGEATEPFAPHMRGEFVSVGPTWGVGWMYSVNLTGLPAIFMKRITYVKYWLQVGGLGLAWRRTREMLAMQR